MSFTKSHLLQALSALVALGLSSIFFDSHSVLVASSGTEKERTNHARDEMPQSRRMQALAALTRMENQSALTTSFASRDYVLQHGFPRLFEPCVLERIFERKHDENQFLQLLLLGGSASTRPATNCSVSLPNGSVMPGRFIDHLEKNLLQESSALSPNLNFRVISRANGNHCSNTDALLLDTTIDTNNTDVIIWEFLINDDDAVGGGPEFVRKLDFWLTRLKVLYAPEKPPPVLITYLWKNGAGSWVQWHRPVASGVFDEHTGKMIDAYRDLGWDLAVVDVGSAVRQAPLETNPSLLFDDNHHPGCGGVRFIASMLQFALYSNLAQNCSATDAIRYDHPWKLDNQSQSIVPPHETTLGSIDRNWQQLWEDLFREDTKIGSITAWEPRAVNVTNLHIENRDELLAQWPTVLFGKAAAGRNDRKNSYVIPLCGSDEIKNLTLLEPDLRWLGLSLGDKGANTALHINNVPISTKDEQPPWKYGKLYINRWIPVWRLVPRTEKYNVSLCRTGTEEVSAKTAFQHLIGVSVPTDVALRS